MSTLSYVNSAAQLSSFECFFILLGSLDFFCEITGSTDQFQVFFLLYCLWVAMRFLLISSNFNLWQHKSTLACVLSLSLAWCETSSVFLLLLGRHSSTVFYCAQFVQANFVISVLFQQSCFWSGSIWLTLQLNEMFPAQCCFFICWLDGYAGQCRNGSLVVLSLNVSISWTALNIRNAWHILVLF